MSSPADFTFNLNVTDLTAPTRQNKLPPNPSASEQTMARLTQVLSRKVRSHAFLLSEDNSPRLVAVEKLARRVVNRDVPDVLQGKRVLSLVVEELLAQNIPDQLEEQLSQMFRQLKSLNAIVFTDDFPRLLAYNHDIWKLFNLTSSIYGLQFISGTTQQEYQQSHIMQWSMRFYQPILLTA